MDHYLFRKQTVLASFTRHGPPATRRSAGLFFSLLQCDVGCTHSVGWVQGQASDIAIQAQEIIKLKSILNNILVTHTGQPLTVIGMSSRCPIDYRFLCMNLTFVEQTLDRDRFMSASEALQFGLIDRVVEKRPEQPTNPPATS